MHIFLLFVGALLFFGNIISAEIKLDYVILSTVFQLLHSPGHTELYPVIFPIMLWNFGGCTVQKLDHGIVAKVKLLRTLQINHAGE